MIARCEYIGNDDYADYGGRGISVCRRWRSGEAAKTGFECFYEDMGVKPSKQHSIDRIEVNGNYEPGNCRWATASEQQCNKRNTKMVVFGGQLLSLMDAWNLSGRKVKYALVHDRLKKGWSVERALTSDKSHRWSRRQAA